MCSLGSTKGLDDGVDEERLTRLLQEKQITEKASIGNHNAKVIPIPSTKRALSEEVVLDIDSFE